VNQRTERVGGEIREVLGEALIRGEIKDPRVASSGLVTITHVRISGDLREAKAFFIVHDADQEAMTRVREGLESASGYLRRLVARQLRLKVIPSLHFEIDTVFEQEKKIDALLHEIGAEGKKGPPTGER
jgi:ribosome-binding factor A